VADGRLPRYPNTQGTFGTSLAVVTALLASISTAVVVVLSADQATQARLGFLPVTPDQAGTITGSMAVLLFVAATLACVYAQAANRHQVPQAVIDALFLGRIDKNERLAEWDETGAAAYRSARICWINGISLFLLTLGTLAYSKVRAELVVAAAIAMVASLLDVPDADFRRLKSFLVSVLVITISGIVCAAAAWAIWSSPMSSSVPEPSPRPTHMTAPTPSPCTSSPRTVPGEIEYDTVRSDSVLAPCTRLHLPEQPRSAQRLALEPDVWSGLWRHPAPSTLPTY
jgi:hypothetical protein